LRTCRRLAATTLTAALFWAAPARAADLALDRQSGFVVPVEVNGHVLRLRVDPGANGVIVLNPEAAERVGLREASLGRELARALGIGMPARGGDDASGRTIDQVPVNAAPSSRVAAAQAEVSPLVQLGPLLARGRFGMARLRAGGSESAKVFAWFESRAVEDADGVISPAELPYATVTFRLSEPRRGERSFTFNGRYTPLAGFVVPLAVRDYVVNVKLSVSEPNSIATAAAAAVIAQSHDGAWSGEVRRHHIALGVMRPVRPLALGRAVPIAAMRVRSFLARFRDNGGDVRLPADVATDPDEIVVTGPGAAQPVRFLLVLGRDQLASCSSIVWQRRSVRLVARCAA
jgi:hypothetical protein